MSRTTTVIVIACLAAACLIGGCTDSSSDTAAQDSAGSSTTEKAVAVSSPSQPGPYQVGRRVVEINDAARGRALTADVWYPVEQGVTAPLSIYQFIPGIELASLTALADAPASAAGPFPLVVYSHGSGGLRYIASWFTEALASHGFVVVAVDHTGNTALDSVTGASTPRPVNALNRVQDVQYLITVMLGISATPGDPLSGTMDPERIGVTGHSFGGFTTLGTAGGYSNELGSVPADERVKAIAVMAPYSELNSDEALAAIKIPSLLVSGVLDITTPIVNDTTRPWDLISGRPLLRMDIEQAGHQSFTDVCRYQDSLATLPNLPQVFIDVVNEMALEGCTKDLIAIDEAHAITNGVTIAFLQTYVAGVDGYETYLSPKNAPVGTELQVKD
jgi:predicted dienelactone hydrolase